MRGAVLLVVVVAAAALVLAPAGTGARTDPRVAVVTGTPVGVHGRYFKPGERIVVTFAAGSALRAQPPRWRYRIVIATVDGLFDVRFPEAKLTRCTSYRVAARGDLGSRAFVQRDVKCQAVRTPSG